MMLVMKMIQVLKILTPKKKTLWVSELSHQPETPNLQAHETINSMKPLTP